MGDRTVTRNGPPVRVLVTGGGGFIGGAVARAFAARGDRVTSFSRGRYPHLDRLGIRAIRGDLTDARAVRAAVDGHDVVVHTAALAGDSGPASRYEQVNVVGTRHVVDACREAGVGRLVYTSTPSVVHTGTDIEGGDEALPYARHFTAAYPATKAAAERIVLDADAPELRTVALRPHLVWGPGDPHFIPRLVDRARRGRLALVGSGDALIDGTYIDNAAAAHLLAADGLDGGGASAGRAYFIAQGEPLPVREMLARLLAAAGFPPVRRRVPFRVAYALGALAEAVHPRLPGDREPVMTRFLAQQLATAHWFDLSAARRDLGYTARVPMEEGMRRLQAALRDAPGSGGPVSVDG